MNPSFIQHNIWIFLLIGAWELVWKGIALWRAAQRNEAGWFIALIIINSAGIFPILYLLLTKPKK